MSEAMQGRLFAGEIPQGQTKCHHLQTKGLDGKATIFVRMPNGEDVPPHVAGTIEGGCWLLIAMPEDRGTVDVEKIAKENFDCA